MQLGLSQDISTRNENIILTSRQQKFKIARHNRLRLGKLLTVQQTMVPQRQNQPQQAESIISNIQD